MRYLPGTFKSSPRVVQIFTIASIEVYLLYPQTSGGVQIFVLKQVVQPKF